MRWIVGSILHGGTIELFLIPAKDWLPCLGYRGGRRKGCYCNILKSQKVNLFPPAKEVSKICEQFRWAAKTMGVRLYIYIYIYIYTCIYINLNFCQILKNLTITPLANDKLYNKSTYCV